MNDFKAKELKSASDYLQEKLDILKVEHIEKDKIQKRNLSFKSLEVKDKKESFVKRILKRIFT